MASAIPLSVLIRSFNEVDRIGAAVRSAQMLGGEILVIDAGSTDGTVALCESLGARVIARAWEGFGPQRRFGEAQCSNEFILSLDADEVLPPETTEEIRALFLAGDPPRLMALRKGMIFPHHKAPPPWGYAHTQILLYDRRIARTAPNPNWDKLELTDKIRPHRIRSPIWHYSLRDWRHAVDKLNYVAALAAQTQQPRHRLWLMCRLLVEFQWTFVKFYIMRRYFLGGVDGLTMAMVSAFGRFLRIAMMVERIKRDRKGR